jgi:outer membrane immunogenic protein
MKRVFTLSAGLLALAAVPAAAADIPMKAPVAAPVMAPAYNWSGCYIGGNGGGKWSRTSGGADVAAATGPGGAFGAFSTPLDGATATTGIVGGQIGCNWQSGNWVFGVEGDADWQRWSSTRTLGATVPPQFVPGDIFDIRSDWQASARGRIGYAFDRTLFYVTGGAAFTNVKVGANFIAFGGFPATVASDSKTLFGATVGGGLEHAFTNNWSFGVEARYSCYGTQTFNAGTLATFGTAFVGPFTFAPANTTYKIETFEVTGRLNYKFDWGGPVVARY